MSEIPEQIDPDSDSDVEYSDALDLDSDLKLRDEFSNPEKQKDRLFGTIEDGDESDPATDDQSDDPLKERQEREYKLTDEEREVNHPLLFYLKSVFWLYLTFLVLQIS
jgi:hypothetical protein